MLWPFIVIGAFWLGYLQAHLWPSRKLYAYLEEHTGNSSSKKLKAKPERLQFKLDVKKKADIFPKDSNAVLQYQKEYCEQCKTYDGHDMCVHYKNFGAVVDKSVNNCIVYRLFKQKENK